MTRVLVLGVSGMLGNAVMRVLARSSGFSVKGSTRSSGIVARLPEDLREHIICGVDVENMDSLHRVFATVMPDVVINCVGLVKQRAVAEDPLAAIPINAMLPHRLAKLCEVAKARFIHFSTDCVFSGKHGMYREEDAADAADLYGRSKCLGEVDYPHTITLRTSIIGHELNSALGLINWFLAQHGTVRGYTQAVFSGLPTVELACVIRDFVILRPDLSGLYHVSAEPIAKYDLLKLVAEVYGKSTGVVKDDQLVIDRSLDSTRFREVTGYVPPGWPALVKKMWEFG